MKVERYAHCSHWGAYSILVQNNEIVGIEPFEHDPAPSPIIDSVREWARSDRRITQPMVRSGWLQSREKSDRSRRGEDQFIPVTWEEVTNLVADEINRVSSNYGNEAIFAGSYGWTSCGRLHHAPSLLKRMLNLVGGYTGHVDTYSIAAGPTILRHVLGDDAACTGGSSTLDTVVEHTETLIVFGGLSPRTAQNEAGSIAKHSLESNLRKIAAKNIKVILVSPLRDDLPEWVGADWWPIRPNTDTALMLGLAGEILKSDSHDKAFLDRCTSGSDDFINYLAGKKDCQYKDAAWASSITGIEQQSIRDLAKLLVSSRSMLTLSWSLQRAHHGEQPYWAGLALAAMVGQIGLPGGGVGYGYASLGGVGAPISLSKSPSISQFKRRISSFIPVARISDMLLNPGADFTYDGKQQVYPDIRLVYWAGGNPFHHHQDLNRLDVAWKKPETIIVQDPMFTPTALRADILLPANTSIERNDIAASKRSDYVLAMHRAIDTVGESKSDFDIFDAVAKKLGVHDEFNEGRNEIDWLRHMYNETRTDAFDRLGFEMVDFDQFWKQGYAECPMRSHHTYLREFRESPELHQLKTESGKIVLNSSVLAKLQYDDCLSHPAWLAPAEWLGNADATQLHLISNQPAGRLHSQLETGQASLQMKRNGREQAKINAGDARRLSINDGDIVKLWSARGACLATATIVDTVSLGVVVLPTGAWLTTTAQNSLDFAGNPNTLTLDIGSSKFGQGCVAHTCLVNIAPYNELAPDAMEYYKNLVDSKVVA
ncbi:molybdopterin-dependent oxidoreductase [Pseudomonas sp. P105]|uniref:molybdopterin-dependent oxidoreductase n=1 Tax=Pseudomonas sp. P105 TaxID=3049542 RepID=UPI002934E71C|nr:molybdopterin-dependent oxidoreductase [Pseudomonas sp. P105]WNZ76530.1 molybdopterin-dependent oxidoreductase [Pseudomonas sp. P105]